MPLEQDQLDKFCWNLVQDITDFEYRLLEFETVEELNDSKMNEQVKSRQSYAAGMVNSCLNQAKMLEYQFGFDVPYRATAHANDNDLNLYPQWILDEGYEPCFHRIGNESFTSISEEDQEKYL